MPVQNNLPVEALLTDVADFSPVLPDAVAQLLLNRAGLDTSGDPRIARIAALSAQKVNKLLHWFHRGHFKAGQLVAYKATHPLTWGSRMTYP